MKTILLFLSVVGSALAQITVTPSGGGGGTPGGSNTQLQYNNASAFGGITGLTFAGTTVTGASGFTLDMSAASVLLPPFSVPFLIPGSASPTVDAVGEIAYDSDFFAASKGALLWYDGTGVRVVPAYTNAVAPTDGQALVWDNTNKWWEPGSAAGGAAVADATGTATLSIVVGAAATAMRSDASPAISQAIAPTWTDAHIFNKAGAASVPAIKATGVPFAGTGTTSFPLVYINDTNATSSTTLNTAGTYFGVNGDGTQDLMNLLKDGASMLKVASDGSLTSNGVIAAGAANAITWVGLTKMIASANGTMSICNSSFGLATRLCFGNATNSAPAFGIDAVNSIKVESTTGTTTFNDASTAGSGTVTNRYIFGIAAPTLTATNSSVTDTVASTVYIGGAPIASTNTTITTPYAFNVAGGVSKFGGPVVLPVYATVSVLPSTAATGMVTGSQAVVQDALAPAYNTAVVGGGAVVVNVYYNGTAWIAH